MKFLNDTKAWFSHRRTVTQLRALSNDALEDIGLTRFDVSRGSASRLPR